MSSTRVPWFAVRREQPGHRAVILMVLSFLIPLGVWCAVSYVPFLWHPMVEVTDAGETYLSEGKLYPKDAFAAAQAAAAEGGLAAATGKPANPVFLPPPHEVARGFYDAFTRPPQLRDAQWFHESLWHSVQILFWGFFYSMLAAVPLGVLAGTYGLFSKLLEPIVDFTRYMPAPLFGALMVAIFGINDAPKIAIIFIGTFFQAVLIFANTTRLLETSLLEAAQTLGANNRQLVSKVIIPGILPNLYNDGRILLGWAWTWLIVAELIGAKSGVTAYVDQQARYFNFELVFPAMLLIGLIGLATDQTLQWLSKYLFPWQQKKRGPVGRLVWSGVAFVPGRVYVFARGLLDMGNRRPTAHRPGDRRSNPGSRPDVSPS